MNKMITLFGASGFVGSHVAYYLNKSGRYRTKLCDVEDKKLRMKYENRIFDYEKLDISDRLRINEVVSGSDIVLDLAAFVRPAMFISRPLDVVKLNLFDCLNVVEACVTSKTRLIHFSTSEVYGKTGGSNEPFQEETTDLILGPINNQRWIYSCAKQLLDRIIFAHGQSNGLEYTLLRPFNFVGPLMDKYSRHRSRVDTPRVFASFMSSLTYGRPLCVVDGGKSRRCFTYIEDAVTAIEAIIDHPREMNRQIVNIGNPANEISIRDLAELMSEFYVKHFDPHANPVIQNVSSRDFYGDGYEDCDRRLPDVSKLKAIGWSPRYDLDATILRSMEYFVHNKRRLVENLGE